MGASNTPLYDLIELSGLSQNTTYTTASGGAGDLVGLVDNATYSDDELGNSSTQIGELNTTADADNGVLTIDGVDYNITLADPDNTNVTIIHDNGSSTTNVSGDSFASDIVFIQASPVGGGATRYFAVVDDSVGDLLDITSIQVRSLDFSPAGNDVKIDADQDNNVSICFVLGTLMETPDGLRPIEDIRAGDEVITVDQGAQPVIWSRSWCQPLDNDLRIRRNMPVRIARGALGPGVPNRDLVVSPQHRILLVSKIAERLCGGAEILVPAKKLVGLPGITREKGLQYVNYAHLLFAAHHLLVAQGASTESLLPDRRSLVAIGPKAREELTGFDIRALRPVRPIVENGPLLREIFARHRKNAKPLVDPASVFRHQPGREMQAVS